MTKTPLEVSDYPRRGEGSFLSNFLRHPYRQHGTSLVTTVGYGSQLPSILLKFRGGSAFGNPFLSHESRSIGGPHRKPVARCGLALLCDSCGLCAPGLDNCDGDR